MMRTIITILLVLFLSSPVYAKDTYVIGVLCVNTSDDSSAKLAKCKSSRSENALTEVYALAGYKVKFVYLPWLRLLSDANSGKIDGCSIRTRQSIADQPNLMSLSTPLLKIKTYAYSSNPEVKINSIEDLGNYTVAARLGDILSTTLAKKYAKDVLMVYDFKHLKKAVTMGYVDAAIMDDGVSRRIFNAEEMKKYKQSSPLSSRYLYHILNKKYEKTLAPKLDKIFRAMILNGTLKRFAGKLSDMIPDESDLDKVE